VPLFSWLPYWEELHLVNIYMSCDPLPVPSSAALWSYTPPSPNSCSLSLIVNMDSPTRATLLIASSVEPSISAITFHSRASAITSFIAFRILIHLCTCRPPSHPSPNTLHSLSSVQSLYDHFSVTVVLRCLWNAISRRDSTLPLTIMLRMRSCRRLPSGFRRRRESWSSSARTTSRGAVGILGGVLVLERK
jgi:hypothetical protein